MAAPRISGGSDFSRSSPSFFLLRARMYIPAAAYNFSRPVVSGRSVGRIAFLAHRHFLFEFLEFIGGFGFCFSTKLEVRNTHEGWGTFSPVHCLLVKCT